MDDEPTINEIWNELHKAERQRDQAQEELAQVRAQLAEALQQRDAARAEGERLRETLDRKVAALASYAGAAVLATEVEIALRDRLATAEHDRDQWRQWHLEREEERDRMIRRAEEAEGELAGLLDVPAILRLLSGEEGYSAALVHSPGNHKLQRWDVLVDGDEASLKPTPREALHDALLAEARATKQTEEPGEKRDARVAELEALAAQLEGGGR